MNEPPARGRRHVWLSRLLMLSVLGASGSAVAQPAKPRPRSHLSVDQIAAEPLVRAGVTALAAGDLTTAERNLEDAYTRWPSPTLLYHLGMLAEKRGQLLAAQDLLRRYQSDPASPADPTFEPQVRRVLALPRPPAGKVLVLSDSGALLRVDNRLVGSLPLVQPLLLSPEPHQLAVTFPAQTVVTQVEVPVGRLAELRVSRGSKAVLLTLLPAYIVLSDYQDLPADTERQVDDAIEHTFQSEKKSVLRRDLALRRAPELKECLDTQFCQDQLAAKNEVDGLLAVRVALNGDGHKVALRLLDTATGDLAGKLERNIEPGRLVPQLQKDITQLIVDCAARTRGVLQVRTEPSGAELSMADRLLGKTPYLRPSFTGRYELVIHKPGYDSIRQHIQVAEGRTTEVIVGMALDVPEPAPTPLLPRIVVTQERVRRPRPNWRLIVGGAGLSAGALVIGLGANALQLNDTCLDPGYMPSALCGNRLQPMNFSIGAITGGVLLVAGSIALAAWPGRWQTTDTFTYSPAEPSAPH